MDENGFRLHKTTTNNLYEHDFMSSSLLSHCFSDVLQRHSKSASDEENSATLQTQEDYHHNNVIRGGFIFNGHDNGNLIVTPLLELARANRSFITFAYSFQHPNSVYLTGFIVLI